LGEGYPLVAASAVGALWSPATEIHSGGTEASRRKLSSKAPLNGIAARRDWSQPGPSGSCPSLLIPNGCVVFEAPERQVVPKTEHDKQKRGEAAPDDRYESIDVMPGLFQKQNKTQKTWWVLQVFSILAGAMWVPVSWLE